MLIPVRLGKHRFGRDFDEPVGHEPLDGAVVFYEAVVFFVGVHEGQDNELPSTPCFCIQPAGVFLNVDRFTEL